MSHVIARGLIKTYGKGEHKVQALRGVNLEINQGEFLAIVGASGSGKSTLLHMLGGLDHLTSGEVLINNEALFNKTADDLTFFRRKHIGFVFQSYNLIPVLTVYENIIFPLSIDDADINEPNICEIIHKLGLSNLKHRMPNQLSGGQQQRVAIARALATKPTIILADEPTGNLDKKNSLDVIKLLKDCGRQFNQTVVMITHNDELAKLADRVVKIEDGLIVSEVRR